MSAGASGWAKAAEIGMKIGGEAYADYRSRKESSKNRKFQYLMSSTAYQRSVADMKAAGLNPILAATKGGASTPSGSQANMPDYGSIANTALSAKLIRSQVEKVQAEASKTRTEETLLSKELPVAEIKADFTRRFLQRVYDNSAKSGGLLGKLSDTITNSARKVDQIRTDPIKVHRKVKKSVKKNWTLNLSKEEKKKLKKYRRGKWNKETQSYDYRPWWPTIRRKK